MKFVVILSLILFSVSCGKKDKKSNSKDVSILNEFVNDNPSSRIPSVDFRSLILGQEVDAVLVVDCNGTSLRGNSGQVGGVNEQRVLAQGTENEGIIQFGHLLRNVNDSVTKDQCYTMTKELYTYKTNPDGLTLCNVKWNVCETFKVK